MVRVRVTWRQVTRWRAGRQLLTAREPDPVAVARRLCGIHAQVTSCGAGIAQVRGAADPDTATWTDRTLVRTWAMRGTLHLLPADELELWTGALTDRESRRRFPPSWEREHGVTGQDLHAITDAVGEVLGATPMSRTELAAAVQARLGRTDLAGPLATGWGALLKPAAARGLLCSGPADGQTSTFVSPAAWLGRTVTGLDAGTANREVLLRFLSVNGPATTADVARWWGEQPAPARRWARSCADDLTEVEIDGESGYLVARSDAEELAAVPDGGTHPGDGPFLLPGFDPWVIAPLSHRRRAVPDGHEKDVSRTAGWISPVLVVDGRVAGVWDRDGDLIRVRLLDRLPAATRRAVEALARPTGVDWT
ncbi:winged helix DNA-binding protein [Pseudonocardia sediminis]|uniref:Winged helix DNA-binding protein n=1 Tax=Pseudonocardia sediminis TaxID=1397368 RepID=A0A4Q7UU34_PSEST|nr:crosslink repair DNA glycosylase YcaQ family protein [Pseudonocardia sediminis]RZT85447.1 winged helix DNA-binding protein [Pseudonocardia sediminis]